MWRSYHLIHPFPHDRFLVDEVKPFVEEIGEPFFFIRYNVPRPHIRLRFRSDRDLDERVRQRFNDVEIVEYVPEIERYGGPSLMPVAETQFECSSRTVLQIMSGDAWSRDIALLRAMRMHRILAEAFAIDAPRFFRKTTKRYLKMPDGEERTVEQFDAAFDRWGDELQQTIDDDWAARWIADMQEIARRFGGVRDLNVLQSYVHMTNNRLGVHYRDEAFIAHMLVRSLE